MRWHAPSETHQPDRTAERCARRAAGKNAPRACARSRSRTASASRREPTKRSTSALGQWSTMRSRYSHDRSRTSLLLRLRVRWGAPVSHRARAWARGGDEPVPDGVRKDGGDGARDAGVTQRGADAVVDVARDYFVPGRAQLHEHRDQTLGQRLQGVSEALGQGAERDARFADDGGAQVRHLPCTASAAPRDRCQPRGIPCTCACMVSDSARRTSGVQTCLGVPSTSACRGGERVSRPSTAPPASVPDTPREP